MAYIYRRKQVYWASYWKNGKRVRVSCRTDKRAEALERLAEYAGEGKAAPIAGRAMLSTLSALSVPVPPEANPEAVLLGALIGRAAPDDIQAALAARLRAWSELAAADTREGKRLARFRGALAATVTGEQALKLPLGEVFAAFKIAPRRRPIRPDTLEAYHAPIWSRFQKWAEPRGRKYLHEITEADALAYMAHLEAENLSPKTRRHARAGLRAVWNALRIQAGLAGNPWKETPAPESEPTHRAALSVPQIKKLFAHATDPEEQAALALGLFAALRLGDVCRLRWADVDMRARMLYVTQSKTRGRVSIPLHPYLVARLNAIRGAGRGFVCPTLAKIYAESRGAASERMARIFTAAKIKTAEAQEGGGRVRAHSIGAFHRLRHTFATLAAAANVPPSAIAALTGHKTQDVLESYTHTDTEQARRAIAALPALKGTRRNAR